MRYQNKVSEPSFEVDAHRLTTDNVAFIVMWTHGVEVEEFDALDKENKSIGVNIPAREGGKRASQGDWVVKLPDGSFDSFKSGEFEVNFERI